MSADRTERPTPGAVITTVDICASDIFEVLSNTSEEFLRALESLRIPRYTEAMENLESACRECLGRSRTITGMGFIGEPENGFPTELSILWWIREHDEMRRKKHVLNPASDSYYDYNTSEWFGTPRSTGKPFITAPYVDSWGTDQLTLTAVIPLNLRGTFIGVIAADLDPALFLRPIERLLLNTDRLTLVDSENRVILSSIPVLTSGISAEPYLSQTNGSQVSRAISHTTNWAAIDLPNEATKGSDGHFLRSSGAPPATDPSSSSATGLQG